MATRGKMIKNTNIPPDGGYGYVIALSLIIVLGVTSAEKFGIIFGPFLRTFGNEGQSSSTVSSVFNFTYFFAGLPANILLQKLAIRKVALIGTLFYVVGGFLTIFITSVSQLTLTYGILQGLGCGLMQPAIATSMGNYFRSKRSFVLNCVLAIVSLINAASPAFIHFSMDQYGFRGTLLLMSAVNLHSIFAAISLHPVKWYLKKEPSSAREMTALADESDSLLEADARSEIDNSSPNSNMGGRYKRVCCIIYRVLDLELFKMPIYLSIVGGMSLTVVSEGLFTALLPWILKERSFHSKEVIVLLTAFYTSDIVGKILLCVLVKFGRTSSRSLHLVGACLMCIFRLVFVFNKSSFWWCAVVCTVLGLTRCLIQNTVFLVVAEVFPNRIITAYTLSSVVCGTVALLLGWAVGVIASITERSDVVLLTLAALPAVPSVVWTIEKFYVAKKKQKS